MKMSKKQLVAALLTSVIILGFQSPSIKSNADEPARYDYNEEFSPYYEQIQAILSGNKKNTDKDETNIKLSPEYGKKAKKSKKAKNDKKNKKKDKIIMYINKYISRWI